MKAQNPDDTSGLGWWESRVCQEFRVSNSVRDFIFVK